MRARLAQAREKLDVKDLPGALAIYEEVLAASGDRADVLVTISGDLGSTGNVAQIVELVAPRYDAQHHGPAIGLNLLQAYLAQRNSGAAQHVLDILFSLNRPELEERLYGFSNAIADMMAIPAPAPTAEGNAAPEPRKTSLASISKPIWFYGLESLATQILPSKPSRPRRIAFAQCALPGQTEAESAAQKPESELNRLSRALPLWLAEPFHFAPHYAPMAAIGLVEDPALGKYFASFSAEWSPENLRQLVETTEGGLDYIFTGALHQAAGDYELLVRVLEVKKFRERKTFTIRWNPATADAELAKLHEQVRTFMECSAASEGLTYVPAARPRAWLDTLADSLTLFLQEKAVLSGESAKAPADPLATAASLAVTSEIASLAYLTLRTRAAKLGLPAPASEPALFASPLVDQAGSAVQ